MKKKTTIERRAHKLTLSSHIKGLLSAFIILFSLPVFSQIPTGYYDNAEDKTGDELKVALHLIIDGHTEYPYTSGGTDVWDILKVADRDPSDPTKVIGIYSGFSMNAANEYDGGNGWSREHVWAKSRGDFGTSMGPGTDLHHIRAEDVTTNSARGNRNFDEAPTQYIDYGGTYSGTTDSYTSGANWIWEPRDEVKGDVARMIFYMTVRYEGTGGEPDLELTDTYLSSGSTAPFQGKASVLMQWHLDDPVDDAERLRNDVIYSYQNNRNPFIDHPEYACLIYPVYCGLDPDTTDPSGGIADDLFISEYIEGSSYNKALELVNITGSSIDLSQYSLKKQVNGSGSWGSEYTLSGSLGNNEVFVIAHSAASTAILDVADVATSSNIVTFNGNDPIGLFKSGVLIDIVGEFNGGSGNFAKDVTIVRKTSVTSPNTTYTYLEWDTYASNTFDYIGDYNYPAPAAPPALADELLFTQYIEGSSYNKALEISNLTESTINLSGYVLKKQLNGSGAWESDYVLTGSLLAGESLMIAHASASAEIIAAADIAVGSSIVTFNGNDPIGLFKDDVLIDIIGTFNDGSANFAIDVSMERNEDVVSPNTTYTTSEWTEYAENTVRTPNAAPTDTDESLPISDDLAFPESIKFYPNPVNDYVFWDGGLDIMNITVINLVTGQQMSNLPIVPANGSVDMSELANGFYGLIVTTHQNQTKMFKLIKQ